ncbi:hypothetical protein BST81_18660 [Leptolyngbya sp. 'hensonii']|nr:hypothetical protein BST81_18660 [Leptolyngbya sp. 'hensonii']
MLLILFASSGALDQHSEPIVNHYRPAGIDRTERDRIFYDREVDSMSIDPGQVGACPVFYSPSIAPVLFMHAG